MYRDATLQEFVNSLAGKSLVYPEYKGDGVEIIYSDNGKHANAAIIGMIKHDRVNGNTYKLSKYYKD